MGALRQRDSSRPSSPSDIDFDKRDLQPDLRPGPDQLRSSSSRRMVADRRTWRCPASRRCRPVCPPRRSRAAAPGTWPGCGCGATGSRSPSLGLFVLIVALLSWRRRSGPTTSPTPGPNDDPHAREDRGRRREARRRQPRRHADRAGLARRRRQVLPRRRRPIGRDEMVRLMYGGRTSLFIGVVAALITTVLAVVARPARRLLPRLDRRGDLADDGRDLGLPGAAARHRARAPRWPSAA